MLHQASSVIDTYYLAMHVMLYVTVPGIYYVYGVCVIYYQIDACSNAKVVGENTV